MCLIIGMCAGRFELGFTHDAFLIFHVTCSCIFHAYVFSFLFYSCFLVVMFSFSLFFSLSDKLCMAPKAHKSIPGQNPLQGSGSSSSNPIPPPHIQFHDENTRKDFLENFQKCGVHPERHVILSDFSDTSLPTIIRTRGWESLLESPLKCPIMFVQEFCSNIHNIDTSVPRFAMTFRGTRIIVTPDLISEVLHVLRVAHHDYPGYDHL